MTAVRAKINGGLPRFADLCAEAATAVLGSAV